MGGLGIRCGSVLTCLALLLVTASTAPRYTNSWAVEVRGGVEVADELARKHGFINHGQAKASYIRTGLAEGS